MRRTATIISLIVFLITPSASLALSNTDSRALNYNTSFYNENDENLLADCSTAGAAAPASSTTAMPTGTTIDQKIGQTFILGFDAKTPKDSIISLFTKYKIGGMYLTGTHNAAAAGFDAAFYAKLNAAAGVPIVASSDEEGVVSRYTYPNASFPPAATMGANAQKIGTAAGAVMKTNGITADLAPVLDLRDVGTGLTGRAFSSNPDTVASQAGAFTTGLETSGISPIFKHFPGFDKTTSGSTDDVKVVMRGSVAKTTAPYKTLVSKFPNAGVMMGNMYVNALDSANPTSLSAKSVTYLRTTIGFSGMITTDDLAVKSVTAATGSLSGSVTKSLGAGVTMPLFASPGDSGVQAIINSVKATVAPTVIDAANTKLLSFKNSKGSTAVTAPDCCPAGGTVGTGTPADLVARQRKVWDGLRAANFSPIQAAGIMGNMDSEAGDFMPDRVEGANIHKPVPPAFEATSPDNPPGYGIVQWTPGTALIPLAKPANLVSDLGWQIDTLVNQLTKAGSKPIDHRDAGNAVKAATTVPAAVEAFRSLFERNLSGPQPGRVTAANKFLAQFGSSTSTVPGIISSANSISSKLTCGGTITGIADPKTLFDDSSALSCANGTKDLGVADGYHDGKLVKIKICAVSNLPSTGQESHNGFGVNGADGGTVVNARVSSQAFAMAAAMKNDPDLKKIPPIVTSSGFRTMAHQQSLCPCDGVSVARPGTSNHQMGLAIDFGGNLPSSPGPIPGNPLWKWLTANGMKTYGYGNYPKEAWHWSATGH